MSFDKLKQVSASWRFLLLMIIIYGVFAVFSSGIFFEALVFFREIVLMILPIFVLVFVLMTLSNYFITPKFVLKHLRDSGLRKWFFVIVGGILSSGPIYMWYPLLADLNKKGLSHGLVACFLYNRAIKIPVLPVAILYFDWKYLLVLMLVMVFMSIVQGILMDKVMGESK